MERAIQGKRLIRLPEVISKTGFCKSSIYAKINEGIFPPPVKIGTRASAWDTEKIDQWIDTRIKLSRSSEYYGDNVN